MTKERESKLKDITVLYVEDDAIVRIIIAKFMRRRCKAVFEAENGKAGVELYKQHEVDIVVTDLEMPVMNGFEMIGHILKIEREQPIIITTGYNDDEHTVIEACKHIIKPIDEEKLLNAIIDCVERSR
ncbi:MAG: response regulator [Nitrospirae bacterium]|nr:response regulator [Nitrospirota bacterium]